VVNLNDNFECDWLIELSDNELPDNSLASGLVENRSFLKPITIEEIVIFIIKTAINMGSRYTDVKIVLHYPQDYLHIMIFP